MANFGPPLRLFPIWAIVFLDIYMSWTNTQLANQPKWTNFKISQQFFKQNSNRKNANSCILGPILWTVLTKKRSAIEPNLAPFQNFQHFPWQNQNSEIENVPTHVFGVPQQCGLFQTNWGVCQ